MSHEIITLGEYEGTAIQCRPSDDYVNATQMCKAAGKLWGNYWQNQEAKDFVGCLSSHIGIPICDLVWSSRARLDNGGGTWVHRRVATHLAQWCSPDFAVWVSGQIEAIMMGQQVAHREHAEFELARVIGESESRILRELIDLKKAVAESRSASIESRDILLHREKCERRQFPESTKKAYVRLVLRFYQGECPCCRKVKVANEQGRIKSVAQVDHFISKDRAFIGDGWLVCRECNLELRDTSPGGFRDRRRSAFDEFHRLLSEHGDAGQLLLPLTETGTTPSILIKDPG